MNKENIGILVRCLKEGGAERAAANLSKDLSEKYNVYILLFDGKDISYPYSGTIIDLNFTPSSNIAGKIINALNQLYAIVLNKWKYKIRTVISFMPTANKYNILTKGRGKSIISIRTTSSLVSYSEKEKKEIIWCGKKADRTVALSEGVKEDLILNYGYTPEKIVTIYNSCDVNWFLQESKEIDEMIKGFDFSNPVFVTAGRFVYQKGQWHLLRAFARVKKDYPKCKLVIFGQGELRDKLKEYAKKLGIEESVYFFGYVKNYHKFMKKCTAFVFSSIIEGLGNVLLEALACGMLVISADCPNGPREILAPGRKDSVESWECEQYGILTKAFSLDGFNENDIECEIEDIYFAEALKEVLEKKEVVEYYSNQALVRAKDFYPQKIKSQWLDILNE